jgi:hypothetical protein
MTDSGEERCIGEDKYKWASASELAGDTGTNNPPPTDDTSGILASIDARLARLVEIKEDDAWDPLGAGSLPYSVLNQAWPTGTIKQEILLPVLARSLIFVADQSVKLYLYDVNANELPLQKTSGTADYPLKQLSLWSLPKSRAIDKLYLSNTSGSTVNIQIVMWG